jgi:hypothetical protein
MLAYLAGPCREVYIRSVGILTIHAQAFRPCWPNGIDGMNRRAQDVVSSLGTSGLDLDHLVQARDRHLEVSNVRDELKDCCDVANSRSYPPFQANGP